MKKVLQVMEGLGRGGAQTFVMNNIKALYKKGIICDFLIRRDNSVYTEEISKYGGKVILTDPFPKKAISNFFQTKSYLKRHASEYCAIHIHANALFYILPIIIAKHYGIPVRIIHSHNTHTTIPIFKGIHAFNRRVIKKYCTHFLACGQDAGRWMFDNQPFEIIKNCIDEEKFCHNSLDRKIIREQFSIPNDAVLIGHVGAFNKQKNHHFIIDVFYEFLKIMPTAKLILLGTGMFEDEIKEKVKSMKIEKNVIFAGPQREIYKYYHTMDVFLFPSLFEGLPFALIESQMAGLPSLISDIITDECIVTDIVYKMSLIEPAKAWAKKLHEIANTKINRESYCNIVCSAGYGIKDSAGRLSAIYLDEN